MRTNTLKQALNAGRTVFGPFVNIPSSIVVEIIGHAGFDFAILDLEHGLMDFDIVEQMVRGAECGGLSAVVRTREGFGPDILRALEVGAAGVQVPHVSSKKAALEVVRVAKYHPAGERGLSPYSRAARYSMDAQPGFTDRLNAESLVIVQVEGVEGLNNLDAILTVAETDVVFLGPNDLSQSLGMPGQMHHPKVVAAMKDAAERIRKAGKAAGVFAKDTEDARRWADLGVQYVSISMDVGILLEACRSIVHTLRN